jgi:hypothetical protein
MVSVALRDPLFLRPAHYRVKPEELAKFNEERIMRNKEKQTKEGPKGPTQVESQPEPELVGRFGVIPEETPGVAVLQAILGHTSRLMGLLACRPFGRGA